MKVTLSEKGQVTIPKSLRDRLGLRPGSTLEFEAEGGVLVGRKVHRRDPVDRVYGILADVGPTDTFLDRVRGPRPK